MYNGFFLQGKNSVGLSLTLASMNKNLCEHADQSGEQSRNLQEQISALTENMSGMVLNTQGSRSESPLTLQMSSMNISQTKTLIRKASNVCSMGCLILPVFQCNDRPKLYYRILLMLERDKKTAIT